ncbi:YggT family protein [Tissierella sp.]|uniref:YggT family protein n=1 Tax=Tissierella sp. TaxID=41274 RepID=UPI0028A64A3E|nr:YggT family protein [Tissierella sp.]
MILLYKSIEILIKLIEGLILVRIVLSFLNIHSENLFTRFVYELTEPVLGPARELIAKLRINTGMLDFSPLLAILFLRIIYGLVGKILL